MEAPEKRASGNVLQRPQAQLEEAAIAILFERIAVLPQDVKDDLFEVFREYMQNGASDPKDRRETLETIMEIMYPQQLGDLVDAPDSNPKAAEKVRLWASAVGKTIREMRERKEMTQAKLSEESGLPQSHLSRIENGVHAPSHKTLKAIAKALGVELRAIDPGSD